MTETKNCKKKAAKVGSLVVPKASLHRASNRLFALSKPVNYLYDISDTEKPTLLSQFNLTSQGSDPVCFMGKLENKAYFSIGYNAIEVVDFTKETEPVSIGVMSDVLIGARWAFLSDNLLITNVKKPVIYQMTSPFGIKVVYEFLHGFVDFVVAESKLICATFGDGLKVYDISSLPASPELVSSLKIDAVKLSEMGSNHIWAEGADGKIYVLDISRAENVEIVTEIAIPGPIASNSIVSVDRHLLVRYKRKLTGDTLLAFDLKDIKEPQKVFELTTVNTPLYQASREILVLVGIGGWDGVVAITNFRKTLFRIFHLEADAFGHVDDIEIEGIWFGSLVIADSMLYIARPDEISLYKIPLS